MANVLFIRGNTATINGTAITDGQLLYNTTTGQHYIDNGSTRVEVGKPVVNTMAEVSAITVDNIPCGTKPVKELNDSLVKIVVSCRNDLIGKTVTCTNGDKNYSAVVGVNLEVVFNVGVTGNWIVSCDNFSKVINANYYGLYNVNSQFVTYGVDIDRKSVV